jgi:hypothetical protein
MDDVEEIGVMEDNAPDTGAVANDDTVDDTVATTNQDNVKEELGAQEEDPEGVGAGAGGVMTGATGLSSNKERISGVPEYCVLAYNRSTSMVSGNRPAPSPNFEDIVFHGLGGSHKILVALFY